jgi:ATP-binding cassette subfamily B protein
MSAEDKGYSLHYVRLNRIRDGNALVELQRELPGPLLELVGATLSHRERVLFSFPVDMNLLGDYAQEWLVLTDARCITWSEQDGDYEQRMAFDLADLKDVRLRESRGNHMLLVDRGNGWEELARSSNLTAWKLKPIRQALQKAADEGRGVLAEVADMELKLPERQVCPKCGRIIRPRLGVCLACQSKRQLLGRLLKLVLPYKGLAITSLVLLLVAGILELMVPLLVRDIVNLVMAPDPTWGWPAESSWYRWAEAGTVRMLVVLCGVWLALLVVSRLLHAVRNYITSWIGHSIAVDLSNSLFAHMMRLSLSFYHREETGRAMSRITRDVNRIHRFISARLQALLYDICIVVFIIVIMTRMQWKLALLSLAPIPLLAVLSEFARRRIHRVYHVLWRRHAGISRFLAGTIPGIRVVKGFAQGRRETGRFERLMGRVFNYEMRATRIRVALEPALHMTVRFGGLIIYLAGGILLIRSRGLQNPQVNAGIIIAFTQYMWRFYFPVLDLARMLPEFEQAATSADRVFEVLDSEPELQTEERVVEMPPIKGKVEFSNVTFGYEPEEPVLHELSFLVNPGEMIGLVGHSGAGKTTLINLVCHFYKADEGQVLVDGLDVSTVKVESLRGQIGIVSQEPFLFSGTIAENIAYGRPDASEWEVIAAAKAANAHEFILKFPEGYDTLVGERGLLISGGERQRIAIARAILKNPRILILDEATSSVDTETEEKIQEALRRLVAGRTTFAIAHRLSTLKHANRLLVLKDGRLVESGTHDELLALGGVYERLCEKQTRLASLTVWQE